LGLKLDFEFQAEVPFIWLSGLEV